MVLEGCITSLNSFQPGDPPNTDLVLSFSPREHRIKYNYSTFVKETTVTAPDSNYYTYQERRVFE